MKQRPQLHQDLLFQIQQKKSHKRDDGVRVPMDVKVGDVILYSKYGGTEIKHGGDEFIVLSARDILAVIEK